MLLATVCLFGIAPMSRALAQQGNAKPPPRGEPAGIIVGTGSAGLPPAVADMRAEIVSAVETGDIAELRRAMDLNELKPDFGAAPGADAIGHLRQMTADGSGRGVLADIGRLFDGSWAAVPGGRDVENNRLYVWPHFAELPLGVPSEEDRRHLTALVGETEAKVIIETRRYRGWRLVIGADGVWHSLLRVPF